jgi:Domain of Unknown Function (DUF1080)
MQCVNCGTQLPQGANACPTCGSISPLFYARSGSSLDGSTATNSESSVQTAKSSDGVKVSSASSAPVKPTTYYGTEPANTSHQYGGSAMNPYGDSYASSPYRTDTPPPPPATQKRKNSAFVVVLCVILLILIGAGVFVFVIKPSMSGPDQTSTAQKVATQSHTTSPGEKQALYSQTITAAPALNDPLSGPDNFGLDKYTGDNGKTKCFFSQNAMHSSAQPGDFSPCYAKATNYQNFVLQVKMTIISGHSGGLVFRANSTNDKGYQFRISTDGTYILNRIILDQQGNILSDGETVASGSSAYIQQGANQTNQLGVLAQGDTISLFVNGKYVDSATDTTYHSGQVGIYVDSDAGAVEGVFSDLQVWKLS